MIVNEEEKTIAQRAGWTRVFFKGSGDWVDVAIGERDRLREAWKAAAAWISVVDPVGCEMDIKLAEVACIARVTPEIVDIQLEQDRILARQSRQKNLFGDE
jgi:hypothetical protein